MLAQLFLMFLDIDVRAILPTIHVPTLVLHRSGDRAVNVRAGRYLAEHIPGATYVELPGIDHMLGAGDTGRVLDELQEFLTGVRERAEPERALATVVFTDLVGSTKRADELGDRRWREMLDAHYGAVRRELVRFRGQEVKTLGDGFLAMFDGPARAIRCALAIVRGVAALGLEARVGLHTGECEIDNGDVTGIAVNIASRVADLAAPGEVLVSRTVKDLVAGSGIAFEDRGTRTLKGLADSWAMFAAVP